jgi:predicted hydrocarbon binding protein
MMAPGKYKFSWEMLGDIRVGRPNLGPSTRLEVYRLMQFTMRDILEQRLGTEVADEVFYDAGYLAGTTFSGHIIGNQESFQDLIKALQSALKEFGIGILRVEEANLVDDHFVLTVSEDLDCSGLPETGEEICVYDEGFIAGILDSFTGKKFQVKEIDCWCTGDRTCRFTASLCT